LFTNIYFGVRGSQFPDHNFRSFPSDDIEQVTEAVVKGLVNEILNGPNDCKTDPAAFDRCAEAGFELDSIFGSTINLRACTSFFRTEPWVPANERDYSLSKLCQYLWMIALECAEACENFNVFQDSLERLLDSIPDERHPNLDCFDWREFQCEVFQNCSQKAGPRDVLGALGDLERFLPDLPARIDIVRSAPNRRRGKLSAMAQQLEATKVLIRKMHEEDISQKETCRRLHDHPRPPRAKWNQLRWDQAFGHPKYHRAVKTWLSKVVGESSKSR
jgi:hypothetical protein